MFAVRLRRLTEHDGLHRELIEPKNDEDEDDKHENDCACDDALLVHSAGRIRSTCKTIVVRERKEAGGTHRRIIFLSVPEARSMDVSARWSYSDTQVVRQ